jgi:hypothetical protein
MAQDVAEEGPRRLVLIRDVSRIPPTPDATAARVVT